MLAKLQLPLSTLLIVLLVVWGHFSPEMNSRQDNSAPRLAWEYFTEEFPVKEFGSDGYFVRAIQNGFNIFYFTSQFAPRFTSTSSSGDQKSCSSCHSAKDIGFSFVQSDRFNQQLQKRLSFEESMMRCYVKTDRINGFAPTIFDPAIRDLRIFSRLIGYKYQLSEGYRRPM